jgi:hypothetical protein
MHQTIICVPTPREIRVCPLEPKVERMVQEEIGEDRADDALNAKDNFHFERTIGGWRGGCVVDLRRKR